MDEWVVCKNQTLREKGLPHCSVDKKQKKSKHTVPKAERTMKEICNCALSKKQTIIQCSKFSKQERRTIF